MFAASVWSGFAGCQPVRGREKPVSAAAKPRRVAVVGAGTVGVSAALWLQESGHEVTLVDRADPGRGTSFGNAGIFATYGCIPINSPRRFLDAPAMLFDARAPLSMRWSYLPRFLPWGLRFLSACRPGRVRAAVRALAAILARAEDGFLPLVRRAGIESLLGPAGALYVYENERSWRNDRKDWARRRAHGVAFRELDPSEVYALEPALAHVVHRGVHLEDVFFLRNPHAVVDGLARAFVQWGGRLLRAEVTAVADRDPGRLEVVCAGERIAADRVVVAAGAWSKRLLGRRADRIPLDTERGYHVVFPGAASLLDRPVAPAGGGFFMTPMEGGLRAAGTVEFAGLDAPPRPARTEALAAAARRLLPDLGEPAESWLGFRPTLPDALPAIGPLRSDPRILCAFGHQHLGMTLGGITGKLVAELVDGREPPSVDLAPFRPDRFA